MGKGDKLVRVELLTKEKERQLYEKEKLLRKKEKGISYREKSLPAREIAVLRKEKESEALNQLKDETNRLIAEKNLRSKDLKALIIQYNKTMQDLRDREQQVLNEEAKVSAVKKEVNNKLQEVDRKEQDIARRELDWIKHVNILNESREMFSSEREKLAQDIKANKAELYLIKSEWIRKRKEFDEEVEELKKERDELKKFIDSDVKILQDKEEEMADLFKEVEKDKLAISREEKSVSDKIRKLERLQKDLRAKEQKLNQKEKQLIARERIVSKAMKYINKEKGKLEEAKELRKQLPVMKSLQRKLERFIDTGKREAIETARKMSGLRRLEDLEKELKHREKTLQKDISTFSGREMLAERIERKESQAFREYVHEELEKSKGEISKGESKHPEIHSLKDQVHRRLESGDVEGAVSLIAQLELLVNKIKDPEEKKMVMYDIKELKANIKLSMLV